MKKPYSLDYNIDRDIDRVAAVKDILDKLEKDPPPNDLEQMGTYILYGKDENGQNAAQRGEMITGNTRYNSYRKKEDKNASLDTMLENPMIDQQEFRPPNVRDVYTKKTTTITRPKYDKKTGALIDPGDSVVPGMTELWECIDHLDHRIHVLEGKIPPNENDTIFDNPYRLYQLKHTLIDLRRHQYYLKDSYNPPIYFFNVDHPRPQFYDWTCDSFYWISRTEWQRRVDNALLHTISKNINDYETRKNEKTGEIEVKWIVRRHTFDWENPSHIRALINNYDLLYNQLHEKLDTYGRTLIFDFERYREMAHLSPVREYLLNKKIARTPYPQILEELQAKYGLKYNENHLCMIYAREIPEKIATAAKCDRMIAEAGPDNLKRCYTCKRFLPRNSLFFSRNRSRRDGYSSNCKECEKLKRIQKGGQSEYDKRSKESALYQMQAREAGT